MDSARISKKHTETKKENRKGEIRMVSSPKYGWCKFEVGEFKGNPSYLTDVPMDLARCFVNYLKDGCGCAYFDEEGNDFTFVISDVECYVISRGEDGEPKLTWIDRVPYDLLKEYIKDMEDDFDAWATEFCHDSDYEGELKAYKKELRLKLLELKNELIKRRVMKDDSELF